MPRFNTRSLCWDAGVRQPEQFAGVDVDIRSDLYSLGVTLWEMVTGNTPFRGSPAEVMYRHQHAPLPVEQLKGMPQPLVVLLEMLLDKDPARRFQNPTEFLNAIPIVRAAIDAASTIAHQDLAKTPPADTRAGVCTLTTLLGPDKISLARLPVTGRDLFGVQALLRELAAFNIGLCVITARLPVADIADHEGTSAPRRDLEHLSGDAGAKLLRALGVKGAEAELRIASDEFNGHCLALTLLGSYLTDAYNGDIRCRKEVSERLAHDVRQGAHARKVVESYQTWLGDGPELSVLRILGLFDRPADEKALGALMKPPILQSP